MSVVSDLERLKRILEDLAKDPRCVEICGYNGDQVGKYFMEALDRAIKRYKSEAARVRKYYP